MIMQPLPSTRREAEGRKGGAAWRLMLQPPVTACSLQQKPVSGCLWPSVPPATAALCRHPGCRFPLLALRGLCGFASISLW